MDDVNWTTVIVAIAAPVATVLAAVVAGLVATQSKRTEERRLIASSRAETDARMLETFVELMDKANARGPGVIAEGVLIELVKGGVLKIDGPDDVRKAVEAVTTNMPVGSAATNAATAAVADLGIKYEGLTSAAEAGLTELAKFNPAAQKQLARLTAALADRAVDSPGAAQPTGH